MLPCVSVPRFLYGDTTSGNGGLEGNGVWEKMKRFIVSFWITLLMITAATTALAADEAGIIAEGECGGYGADVRWSLSTDGTLTISGTGPMADYWSDDSIPWSVYRGQIRTVEIEAGVTSIGNSAFSGCSGLTNVTISGSVTSIGGSTFSGCSGLTSVTIPESVTSIRNSAFYGCGIRRVDYLGTIASWCAIQFESGGQPFASNPNGGQLYIGGQLITDVVIPEEITSIENYTFAGVKDLTSVIIPDGVTSIGDSAFSGCSGLTSVEIPGSVTRIGDSAFSGCSSLTNVDIPAEVTFIGSSAFYQCRNLTSITIPSGITSIGGAAFFFCSKLTSVSIPEGVVSIGASAFGYCASLTGIVLPASLSLIGDRAFFNTDLTSILIPVGVRSIEDEAFGNCSSLTCVEFLGDAPTVGDRVFGSFSVTPGQFCIYYHSGTSGWTSPTWNGYPSACIDMGDDYSTLNGDNRNQQDILFTLNETGKTATVGYASKYSKNTSGYTGAGNGVVVIPDTVTKDGVSYRVIGIEQGAFSDNLFVREVVLGENLSSIQPSAFSGCSNFTAFRLGTSTRYSVEDGVLYDYGKYQLYIYPAGKPDAAFRVPDSVTDIAREAFATAAKLQTVVVPDTVLSIGRGAFAGCNGLVSMTLPFIGSSREDSLPFSELFYSNAPTYGEPQMKNLREVVITDEGLKGSDFSGSTNISSYTWAIESITLPSCPAEIPEGSFLGCKGLKNLYFTEGGAAMTDGVLVIPDHVTAIRNTAFAQCNGIREVYLPAATTALNSGTWSQTTAFGGCDGLQRFAVAEDNPAYSSDKWGVLFNKDKTQLLQYPSDRQWPYYNVPDSVNSIWQFAFQNCGNLINLYIPFATVGMSNFMYNCPSTSLCVYRGSPAAQYAAANNLSYWFLDNYTLQRIYIHTLPEETVFVMGQEDFSGLYVVGNYGGKELQMDTYTLTYDPYLAGPQMVKVSNGDKTAQFEITLLESGTERIDLGPLEVGEGQVAFGAVYAGGRMLLAQNAEVFSGHAYLIIPKWARDQMTEAKVFLLKAATFMPV